jgi:hypothetical protein
MSEKYFVNLTHLPLLNDAYVTELEEAKFMDPLYFINENTGPINRVRSSFINSKFCQDITEHFGVKVLAEFYKVEPFTFHKWHRDAIRNVAVNFTIYNNPGSMTFFGEPTSDVHSSLIECHYELRRPMLFNTGARHCILNNSGEPRYLLSVSLVGKDLKFIECTEWFRNYRCDSY